MLHVDSFQELRKHENFHTLRNQSYSTYSSGSYTLYIVSSNDSLVLKKKNKKKTKKNKKKNNNKKKKTAHPDKMEWLWMSWWH